MRAISCITAIFLHRLFNGAWRIESCLREVIVLSVLINLPYGALPYLT